MIIKNIEWLKRMSSGSSGGGGRKQQHVLFNTIFLIIIMIITFVVYMAYYMTEEYESYTQSIQTRSLEKDGFCVLHNPDYATHTVDKPCNELHDDVLNKLPNGYVFIDYVYKIRNASLSTFHRDVTSSKHIFDTTHPVYTLILYKYNGELLSVCPASDKSYPFAWSRILNINGRSGTVFLFDCDLLHAGRINQCRDRDVIQYKICHESDIHKLQSLNGIRMEKTDVCVNTLGLAMKRTASYFFEMPINYIAYPLMIKRERTDSIVGWIQSLIPLQFYNNS